MACEGAYGNASPKLDHVFDSKDERTDVTIHKVTIAETSGYRALMLEVAELKARILDVEKRVLTFKGSAAKTSQPLIFERESINSTELETTNTELKLLEFPPEYESTISDTEITRSEADLYTNETTTPEPTTPIAHNVESWTFGTPVPRSETPMTELDSSSQASHLNSPKQERSDYDLVEERGSSTVSLAKLPLFQPRLSITRAEAFELSYRRAKALNKHYGLTVDDIMDLSPRFFDMHKDDIIIRDIGSHALLSIQHNLAAGTIAPYAKDVPGIQELLEKILNFEVSYVDCRLRSQDFGLTKRTQGGLHVDRDSPRARCQKSRD